MPRPTSKGLAWKLAVAVAVTGLSHGQESRAGDLPAFDRVRALTTPRVIPDAELTDQFGEPFRLSQLQGRVAIVLFGYTHCPDVCPITLERFRQLEHSGKLSTTDMAFVMISVDGERDTPAVMKAYIERFSRDFIGLTAEPEKVKRLASAFSAAFFKGHEDAAGHYGVAHSPQVFVLDAAGRLRAEFYNASLDAMAGTAAALLTEHRH